MGFQKSASACDLRRSACQDSGMNPALRGGMPTLGGWPTRNSIPTTTTTRQPPAGTPTPHPAVQRAPGALTVHADAVAKRLGVIAFDPGPTPEPGCRATTTYSCASADLARGRDAAIAPLQKSGPPSGYIATPIGFGRFKAPTTPRLDHRGPARRGTRGLLTNRKGTSPPGLAHRPC